MRKNFIIKKIKKGSEPKLYIFYNLTKNQGIKRMRPKSGESDIQIGEIVKMNGEQYRLDVIFDYQNGELISWIGDVTLQSLNKQNKIKNFKTRDTR